MSAAQNYTLIISLVKPNRKHKKFPFMELFIMIVYTQQMCNISACNIHVCETIVDQDQQKVVTDSILQ